jgi:serine-type D-Ala-D-Ala carboxypeptidase/endopeptidase
MNTKEKFSPLLLSIWGIFNVSTANAFSLSDSPAAIPPDLATGIDGFWLGRLTLPHGSLRIQLTVSASEGQRSCFFDSLDQRSYHMPCANLAVSGNQVAFDIPAVEGHWNGELTADGRALTGTWTQGTPLPLNFDRKDKPVAPDEPKYDPAMTPVDPADMKQVLDRDLKIALKEGDLAPSTDAGMVIGLLHKGKTRIFCYGTARPDSMFEIGSITKTFTALVLAQMAQQGSLRIQDPVRKFFPEGMLEDPKGSEITLVDLATQHSGLPYMPDNMKHTNPRDPYADYTLADLQQFLVKHGVQKPPEAGYLYSNFGFAVLGQALANRAGVAYATLLRSQVLEPLNMNDTAVDLSAGQRRRFVAGHLVTHEVSPEWNLNAFAGAGAIRSTAADLLKYLQAQLHPEKLQAGTNPASRTISAAIEQTHELLSDAGPKLKIALAWNFNDGAYWHNGATGGYSSMAMFYPEKDFGVVVLFNTTVGRRSFADIVAAHVDERFLGIPAISLDPLT